MEAAAQVVLATTGGPAHEHMRAGGWYSHSVLATVLGNTAPRHSELRLAALKEGEYDALLHNTRITGALVNQDNTHWIALVKHAGLLWKVDSRLFPTPLGREAFRDLLRQHPHTFPVQRCP